MKTYYWGDNSFDWNSLYKAESEIRSILKYGRVGIHSKEKYSTLCYSIFFCDGTLHSFIYPGYVYSQFPKWLWVFDLTYKPLRLLAPIIRFWQKLIVEYAFKVVCDKYPHIRDHIINDAPIELLPCNLAMINAKMWFNSCKHCGEMSTKDNYICTNCGELKHGRL
jgi:hypothetical protein